MLNRLVVAVSVALFSEALKSFKDSLGIRDQLAKGDPGNSGWQRDLSESQIGRVIERQVAATRVGECAVDRRQ